MNTELIYPDPRFMYAKDKPIRGLRHYGVSIDDAAWFPVGDQPEDVFRILRPRMKPVQVSPLTIDPLPFLLAMRR